MSFKTTYILFGVLALLIGLVGVLMWMGPAPETDSTYVLPSMHGRTDPVSAGDIDQVRIDRARPRAETVVFARDSDKQGWHITEPHEYRADHLVVDQLIRQIVGAQKEDKRDVTSNLKQWDLEPPAATFTLKKGDREWKLFLGGESAGGSSGVLYVASSDRPKEPMAVKQAQLDTLLKSLNDYRSKELLAGNSLDIDSVSLQDGKHEPVVLQKGKESQWRFVKPAYGEADYEGGGPTASAGGAPSGVRGLLEAVAALRVDYKDGDKDKVNDFVEDNVSDLAKYGLEQDKPEKLRIEVKRTTGGEVGTGDKTTTTVALLVGKKADDKGEKYYARLANEKNVVRISAKSLEPISAVLDNPSSVRDRDLVHLDANKVDALNIQNSSGLLKLRRNGEAGQWKLFRDSGRGEDADPDAIEKLLGALTVKRLVKDFPDPKSKDSDLQLDKPLAVLSVWVDGVSKDEKKDDRKDPTKKEEKPGADKKDSAKKEEPKSEVEPKLKSDKPTVKLTFGKRDTGKHTLVVRREVGDESTLLEVPDTLADQVAGGPLAFLDHALPSFSKDLSDPTKEVTRLMVVRNGETFEIEKETKDGKANWILKQPKDVAGRRADPQAVASILDTLSRLRAEKLIAEKLSDTGLVQDGLHPPQLQVTVVVTRDGKPQEHVYQFGKESDDKSEVYGKQGERELVFTVRAVDLTSLHANLVDPRLYSFKPEKVHELKLSGWKKALGLVATLDVERKTGDKAWTVKSKPDGFDPDEKKIDDFLPKLANLAAESFVVYKTGPKPEYGLSDADRSLSVEISVEGEKAPIVLTIGNLDEAKKGYFAQTSTLPGDVFLLPKDAFDAILSGIKYFGK